MHAAPMYIAETAPSQIRGRMISLKEFSTVLGMVVSSRSSEDFWNLLLILKLKNWFTLFWYLFVHQVKLTQIIFWREVMESVAFGSRLFLVGVTCTQQLSLCQLLWELECVGYRHLLGGFYCALSREKEMWRIFNRLQLGLFAALEGLS